MTAYLALCVTILMSFINKSHLRPDKPCTMPNGQRGNCIPLEQCEYLQEMVNSRIYGNIQYARRSQCDAKGRQINVCCPLGTPIENNGRTLPSVWECGKILTGQIGYSSETMIGEHPWAAQIIYKNDRSQTASRCGGVLINSRYILTAAHCLSSQYWKPVQVRLGEWDTKTNPDFTKDDLGQVYQAPPHIDVDIEKTISYQNYITEGLNQINDIGLIRLAQPVNFTNFVLPICLPIESRLREKNYEDEYMEVLGWSSSNIKSKAYLPIVGFETCHALYSTVDINLRTSQLCAGGAAGIDSCRGDSGGPLVGVASHYRRRDPYAYLSGIVSFGAIPCGSPGWPGVYTRVATYIDWIQSTLEP